MGGYNTVYKIQRKDQHDMIVRNMNKKEEKNQKKLQCVTKIIAFGQSKIFCIINN